MDALYQFNRIARARHGNFIYNLNDLAAGRSLDLYGEFAEQSTAVFDQVLEPGAIVLDIGAGIGVHSVFFAHKVAPTGRLLAFEPQRILFQTLCGNLALNSASNAFCWNMAVGDANGTTTVPYFDVKNPDGIVGVSLGGHQDGESVAVVTVDSLNLHRCDLIKLGCEGMEEQVIAGARSTISRFKPLLYIECDRAAAQPTLLRQLDALGYSLFWHATRMYSPQNFNGNALNVFGERGSKNILCIDKAAQRQLTGFAEVAIPHAA